MSAEHPADEGPPDITRILPSDPATALQAAPHAPGSYIMRDGRGAVLYVGKAKDLKNRLRQYFAPELQDERPLIRLMLPQVASVEVVVTATEKEALLLENTLIKRYRPPNNLRIRDDKTYFSLHIDLAHPYPRVQVVRRRTREDLGKDKLFFGPYDSARDARSTLRSINRYFSLRDCSELTFQSRTRPCLRHQMHRCHGPCSLPVDQENYREEVRRVRLFLEGNGDLLIPELTRLMHIESSRLEFEKAARYRDQIRAIAHTIERQRVDLPATENLDLVAAYREGEQGAAVVLPVREGRMLEPQRYTFSSRGDADSDVMTRVLMRHYEHDAPPPPKIFTTVELDDTDALTVWLKDLYGVNVRFSTPQRGESRSLLALALRNARQLYEAHRQKLDTSGLALQRIARLLKLPESPSRVECYDISLMQGSFAVGSMVCFIDGAAMPRLYRRYRIKAVEGQDDFAMLAEVLTRRIRRGATEGDLPDLIVMDGGKGQLSQAMRVLRELAPQKPIAVIALAKERTLRPVGGPAFASAKVEHSSERIFVPGIKDAVRLKPGTAERHLMERLRDEAHRFAIEYHRLLRSRQHLRSMLEDIPGVGEQRRILLLRHFGSLKRVKDADLDALCGVPGLPRSVAEAVHAALHAAPPQTPPRTEPEPERE